MDNRIVEELRKILVHITDDDSAIQRKSLKES
ncbi:hypothetical protein LIAUS_05175 [Leptospira interrogans]